MKKMQTAEKKKILNEDMIVNSGIAKIFNNNYCNLPEKNFGTSTGFEPYDGLCVSGAVLYRLS